MSAPQPVDLAPRATPSPRVPDGGAPASVEGRLRTPPRPAMRISLFAREVRERLAAPALDLLFERARVLSEGGRVRSLPRADGARAPEPFFGSTMLTLDLHALADHLREPALPPVAARVAELLVGDARAGRRARQIAEREAARIAGAKVMVTAAEVRVRALDSAVLVDVDLEGTVEPARRAAAAGSDSR